MRMSRIIGFVAITAVVVLSGCGGGGGGGPVPTGGVDIPITDKYPDCELSPVAGKGNIAGCWISEQCASARGMSVRYLAEITEEVFTPITKGSIYSYRLVYDSPSCEGDPVDVVSMADQLLDKKNAVLHIRYALQGDSTKIPWAICSDTTGQFETIPCIAMNITSEYRRGGDPISTLTSKDVFHYGGGPKVNGEGSSDEWYLCMSSAYNFSNDGNGGIGVGYSSQDRDTVLDLTDCLTRFEP